MSKKLQKKNAMNLGEKEQLALECLRSIERRLDLGFVTVNGGISMREVEELRGWRTVLKNAFTQRKLL